MRPGKATAQDVAPLVFELARAIRARRIHPAAHPVALEAQQRCESAWQRISAEPHEFTLEVGPAGLALGDGAAVVGPGASELADELRVRQVFRLQVHGAPSSAEIALLVGALAREPEALAQDGGLGELLRGVGASALEVAPPTPNRDASAAAASAENAERNAYLTQHIAELVRLLAELERCDDLSSYNLTANKMETCVEALVRAKRCMDAYRAALVLSRHATDKDGRSDGIRREAVERLGRLARNDELLDAVVEQACVATGLASVQASQVLIGIGALAVPRLLRHLESRKEGGRARATQMLIALGDAALAQVVDELSSQQPERARRAARLLGEMQNPKGVSFLTDALRSADPLLAREAAQALARIGDDAAVHALVTALEREGEVAEACAACLGGLRHPAAARALGELIDLRSQRPEGVRRAAIRSLGRLASPEALARLKRILDHAPFFGAARFRGLRVAAAQAIGQIGGPAAVQALQAHARSGDPAVRQACQEALRRLERAAGREK
jgi:HEAT repeat protein